MDKLSLPVCDLKTKQSAGKTVIFDIIRRKYVALTPEEWVRQHFIHYLINHLGYPKGLLTVEQGLRYNALRKRTDIVVYDRQGEPVLVVECKAPVYPLRPAMMEQAMMYNKTIGADYLLITNGIDHSCLRIDRQAGRVVYLDAIPGYEQLATK